MIFALVTLIREVHAVAGGFVGGGDDLFQLEPVAEVGGDARQEVVGRERLLAARHADMDHAGYGVSSGVTRRRCGRPVSRAGLDGTDGGRET